MDNRNKAELELISVLEVDQQVSQFALGKRLNIAAGLVNILMKRAVKKGFVKMKQVPARRFAYYITRKGFAEKAKLVAEYLSSSLDLYRRLRIEYRDMFEALEVKEAQNVVLVGSIDVAEVAIMAAFDTDVTITALINTETNNSHIGSIPILPKITPIPDAVFVICNAENPQACFDDLTHRHQGHMIKYPSAFFISTKPPKYPKDKVKSL